MFGKGGGGASAQAAVSEPRGFDRKAFLSGAEAAYRHLQESWDRGDLADLRALTTDAVFAELQDQLRERKGENRTELLKVSCELLEAREVGKQVQASVMFDVMMREVGGDSDANIRPYQVREVWHFMRPVDSSQPTWFLDGIQQLED
jgi:predicted lipid-binding transport protein (Tim44 family)